MGDVLDLTPLLAPERASFVTLLRSLDDEQWVTPTECPGWTVKDLALHVLGDDLSLLSRQRDRSANGVLLFAHEHPGLTFMELLDGFNEQWVIGARFFSTAIVVDLLERTGEQTAGYYGALDLDALGEPVGFFASGGAPSPWWQVIAREYVERWIHHEQIRRALGLGGVDDELAEPAMEVILTAFGRWHDDLASFSVGERTWTYRPDGAAVSMRVVDARDVLSRALSLDETMAVLDGDPDLLRRVAQRTCRGDDRGA